MPAEIDIANEREVAEELNAVLGMRPCPLVVDMTETRFCDSSGMAAVVRAWKRAAALHVPFRVAVCSDSVLRVLRVLGADRLLQVYPSLAAAKADEPPPGCEPGRAGA